MIRELTPQQAAGNALAIAGQFESISNLKLHKKLKDLYLYQFYYLRHCFQPQF